MYFAGRVDYVLHDLYCFENLNDFEESLLKSAFFSLRGKVLHNTLLKTRLSPRL